MISTDSTEVCECGYNFVNPDASEVRQKPADEPPAGSGMLRLLGATGGGVLGALMGASLLRTGLSCACSGSLGGAPPAVSVPFELGADLASAGLDLALGIVGGLVGLIAGSVVGWITVSRSLARR
ncbi:MAG: hypothetical protein AAF938_03520 [Myxococcota bacterium]